MFGTSIVDRGARQKLARRMLAFYGTTAAYYDEVKQIANVRPSAEELVLFEALVRESANGQRPLKVLELGCGRCESAPRLMQMLGGGSFHGVEASPAAVAHARQCSPDFNLKVGDISALEFSPDSFDIVYMNYVLEHTCEPDRVLDEALRVLRPGGVLGMIVPVTDLPWNAPQSLQHRKGDAVFMLRFTLERWVHLLRLHYSRDYFAFPLVEEPRVLSEPGSPFVPDDDQVYVGCTFELIKYLQHRDCEIAFQTGRDISSYIRNGRRPGVDLLRGLLFQGVRASLGNPAQSAFTSTVTLVARKR